LRVVLDELGDGNGAPLVGHLETGVPRQNSFGVGAFVLWRDPAFVAAERLAHPGALAAIQLRISGLEGGQGNSAALVGDMGTRLPGFHCFPVRTIGDGRRHSRIRRRHLARRAADLLPDLQGIAVDAWVILEELVQRDGAALVGNGDARISRFPSVSSDRRDRHVGVIGPDFSSGTLNLQTTSFTFEQ
jgi:hypothetical protein